MNSKPWIIRSFLVYKSNGYCDYDVLIFIYTKGEMAADRD